MAARITKYLNKYVRRDICLIYMSSFYFWSYIKQILLRTYLLRYLVIRAAMGTGSGENIGKTSYFNIPPDIGFTLKNHGRVGQNCRLYNHYGSIFVHFRSPG
jgi:hypothetical protein